MKEIRMKGEKEGWDAAMAFLEGFFDHPERLRKMPKKTLILPITDDETAQIFTRERIRIMRTIDRKKPRSMRALAKELNRELSAVGRDMQILEAAGIVKRERMGKEVRPILEKHVLILPIVHVKPIELRERIAATA